MQFDDLPRNLGDWIDLMFGITVLIFCSIIPLAVLVGSLSLLFMMVVPS